MFRRSAEKLSNVPFNRQSIKSIYFALLIGMSFCPSILWTYVRLLAALNNIFLENFSKGQKISTACLSLMVFAQFLCLLQYYNQFFSKTLNFKLTTLVEILDINNIKRYENIM